MRLQTAFETLSVIKRDSKLCLKVLHESSSLFTRSKAKAEHFQLSLDLSLGLLDLLSTALQDHWGNRKYFRKRVEHGGWIKLEEVLSQLLDIWAAGDVDIVTAHNRLFGALYACAIERNSTIELFEKLETQLCKTARNGSSSERRQSSYSGSTRWQGNPGRGGSANNESFLGFPSSSP